MLNQKEAASKRQNNHGASSSVPYGKVFLKCFPQCFNVFLVFFVTLSVFPVIQAGMYVQSVKGFLYCSIYLIQK